MPYATPLVRRTPRLLAVIALAACAFAAPLHAQLTTQVWVPKTLTVPEGTSYAAMDFGNADTGFVLTTAGTIYRTFNGGDAWDSLPKPTAAGSFNLGKIDFINGKTGWIVGSGGTILKTTDAGASWSAQVSGTTRNLYLLQFLDANRGWAKDVEDSLLRTTNGGLTWTRHYVPREAPSFFSPSAIHFPSPDTGWLVGTMERKLRTINGGLTWTDVTDYTQEVRRDLNAVHFVTPRIGWVAGGSSAYISKTIDGGATWTSQPPGAFGSIRSLAFVDTLTGWAVGHGGTLLKTINGGTNWHDQDFADQFVNEVGFGEQFSSVQSFGVNSAIAMSYQLVIKTPATGTSVSRGTTARRHAPSLAMNGASSVRFILPEASTPTAVRVRLDVLDARGAVVTNVFNGTRNAGEHRVSFDARRIPVGVYTLRLVVGQGAGAQEALSRVVLTR